jgi:hypothetical protein
MQIIRLDLVPRLDKIMEILQILFTFVCTPLRFHDAVQKAKKQLHHLNLCLHTVYVLFLYLYGLDRFCGLLVRVPGYRSWGPGFDSRRYQIFWEVVGLERDPLSLVRITEELTHSLKHYCMKAYGGVDV